MFSDMFRKFEDERNEKNLYLKFLKFKET